MSYISVDVESDNKSPINGVIGKENLEEQNILTIL